jgi:DNA-binding GntR family transcriptional regulator
MRRIYGPDEELVPPWVLVKNGMIREIVAGVLEPGDEVWVIYEAEDYGVERKTAAKAFRALVDEGWLTQAQGTARAYRVAERQ